jgi:hypothetical protein
MKDRPTRTATKLAKMAPPRDQEPKALAEASATIATMGDQMLVQLAIVTSRDFRGAAGSAIRRLGLLAGLASAVAALVHSMLRTL